MKHEQSEAINEWAAAMAKARLAFPKVAKTKKAKIPTKSGKDYSYSYADLGDILDAVTPFLSEHGLVVSQTTGYEEGRHFLYTAVFHTSGQWVRGALELVVQGNDAKALGSAITYARRYALSSMLSIAADEDDDGQASWDKSQRGGPVGRGGGDRRDSPRSGPGPRGRGGEERQRPRPQGVRSEASAPPPALPEGHFLATDTGEVFSPETNLTAAAPFGLGEHSGLIIDELPPDVLDRVYREHIEGKDPKGQWGEGSSQVALLRCLAKVRARRKKTPAAPGDDDEASAQAPADTPTGRAKRRAMEQAREESRGRRSKSTAPARSRSQPVMRPEKEPGEAERLRQDLWSYLRLGSEGEADERGAYSRLCVEAAVPPIRLEEQSVKDLRRLHRAAGYGAVAEGVGA